MMADLLEYHWLALLLAAPCVGSFLGVVAARLPAGRTFVRGRSACPICFCALHWWETIPLVSWTVLRARCRVCGSRVSIRYPAIELAALGIAGWSLAVTPGWLAWASASLGWSLLVLAVIDFDHLILPDEITLPLIPAGLAVAWAVDPARLADHAIGAVAGFLIVLALRWAYQKFRKREGIGLGDAKLLAAVGAWVSWEGVPGVLLIGAAAALVGHVVWAVLAGRGVLGRELPFGPYLAAGLWVIWLYGPITVG